MLYDCILEVKYNNPTPFIKFTLHNPNIEVNYWCNSKVDILIIRGTHETAEQLAIKLNTYFQNVEILSTDKTENIIILKTCKCSLDPLDPILDQYGSLDIPPIKFFRGTEIHRIILGSDGADDLINTIKANKAIKEVSIKKLAPLTISKYLHPLYLSVEDIIAQLTAKQLQALTMAYMHGYYEIPRKIRIEDMATDIQIHRRTFEEHLRKGENTLMSFIIPILQIINQNIDSEKPHV